MRGEDEYRSVLEAYPTSCQTDQAEFLCGADGFSGALFWKLETSQGTLCLRKWPARHPDQKRLRFLHHVLQHVYHQGFHLIPQLFVSNKKDSFVVHAGHFWELTNWLPGEARYHAATSREKLRAAMKALAEFHLAAASFEVEDLQRRESASPAVAQRVVQLAHIKQKKFQVIAPSIGSVDWPELESTAHRLLELFPLAFPHVSRMLQQARGKLVPLQPAIRDVWHDHLLFLGEEVSGIVDFGAMKIETVAGDVARLLGSLVGDCQEDWDFGLKAYQELRPLNSAEISLVHCFDLSTVLISGMNWLDWVYVQGRCFDNRPGVVARMNEILIRLQHLVRLIEFGNRCN